MAAGSTSTTVPPPSRRARLLRFLAPWTTPGGGYEVRVGPTRLSAEVLTDDALSDFRTRIARDVRSERTRRR